MAEAPAFDPTKPFEVVTDAPPFDPSKPYETVVEPSRSVGQPLVPLSTPEGTVFNPPPPSDLKDGAKAFPSVVNIMAAFGEAASMPYQERLGLSNETLKWLQETGIFPKHGDPLSWHSPFRSFNEQIIAPAAAVLDFARRFPGAVYGGLQAAGVEAGLPRDVVSLPDAWLGSPGGLGVPKPRYMPREVPAEPQPQPIGLPRSRPVLAKTGEAHIDALLDAAPVRQALDSPVIDRNSDVPAGVNRLPTSLTIDGATFDPAEPLAVRATVERAAAQVLTRKAAEPERVQAAAVRLEDGRVLTGPSHIEIVDNLDLDELRGAEDGFVTVTGRFVDRDEAALIAGHTGNMRFESSNMKPDAAARVAQEYGAKAESAWYAAHGIDQAKAEEALRPFVEQSRQAEAGGRGDYIKRVGSGDADVPTVDDISKLIDEGRKAEREHFGMDEATQTRLRQLNREIDQGNDAAIAEKNAILAKLPKDLPDLDIPAESDLEQLRTEYRNLEKASHETPEEYVDGIARTLKRYIADFTSGDDFARAVFRKAFEQAREYGIDTKRLGNDVISRFMADLSSSDQAFMRDEFAKFTTPKLAGPAEKATAADRAQAKEILTKADENGDLQPPVGVDLADMQALGVIGPPKPPASELPPAEAARAATADPLREPPGGGGGSGTGGPTGGGSAGGGAETNPWRQRFEHFVGKLDAPEDVKDLIRRAADENGEFLPARTGDIPLRHVTGIAEAAGVDVGEINVRGLGRNLRNDAEVRIAMQMMLQVTDDVKTASREVKAEGSPENLIKLQEAIMRRDMAVEQVVGLRAEWGRTGNVFQEFLKNVRDEQQLSDFLKTKGRNPEDLKDIANAVDALDREGAARALNELRGKQVGPIYWTWVNGLISGILTHTKYVAANALYAVTERGITTPIASIIGKARELAGIGSDVDRVFFGEGMAATYGMLAATPTSFMTAARSVRAGMRVPLQSEIELRNAMIARGEKVPASMERTINPVTGIATRPIGGILGRVLGAPGDVAGAIHTFFKVMGERAGIEAEAYHGAAAEGLNPTDAQFWVRRAELAANPTEAMRQKAVEEAYKSTFMQELGPKGQEWSRFSKGNPVLRWIFPFSHIPINLMKATYEYTPAAVLDGEMRAALKGEHGQRAQDMAIARMAAGSSVMAWFTMQALNGRVTGDMPRGNDEYDRRQRDVWKLEGKQPNSILIGDHWVSFNKFGPAGDLANIGANLGAVIQTLREGDDDAMTKATWRGTEAAAHLIVDEVGFQSLANLMEAVQDPDRFGPRWVASTVGSFVPFSSLMSQTASVMDPSMRDAKTVIDGLKYRIPLVRETLLPKRDWTGAPIDNPQYGNILRQTRVNVNAVDMEAVLLGIHAAPPPDRVGTVKLPPHMYDEYQVAAGLLTRQSLEQIIRQPNYYNLPVFAREEIFKKMITAARQQAAAMLQMRHPEIIQQGLDNIRNKIEGNKATKLQDVGETSQWSPMMPTSFAAQTSFATEPARTIDARSNEFPTQKDVAFARENEAFYGEHQSENYLEGNRIIGSDKSYLGKTDVDISKDLRTTDGKVIDLNAPENKDLKERFKDTFFTARLAAGRSAIASLGFDPSKIRLDTNTDKLTIAGITNARTSTSWIGAAHPMSTIVHESIHRGLEELRRNQPEKFEAIWRGSGVDDESIVRYIMHKTMGDTETDAPPEQRQKALRLFGSEENRQRLEQTEALAAKYIAEKRRGGPR